MELGRIFPWHTVLSRSCPWRDALHFGHLRYWRTSSQENNFTAKGQSQENFWLYCTKSLKAYQTVKKESLYLSFSILRTETCKFKTSHRDLRRIKSYLLNRELSIEKYCPPQKLPVNYSLEMTVQYGMWQDWWLWLSVWELHTMGKYYETVRNNFQSWQHDLFLSVPA